MPIFLDHPVLFLKEMDRFILELRQLLSTNEIEAAKFLPSCISYIDETEKILSTSKLPPTYSSRSTTPCRVFPIVDDVNFFNTL